MALWTSHLSERNQFGVSVSDSLHHYLSRLGSRVVTLRIGKVLTKTLLLHRMLHCTTCIKPASPVVGNHRGIARPPLPFPLCASYHASAGACLGSRIADAATSVRQSSPFARALHWVSALSSKSAPLTQGGDESIPPLCWVSCGCARRRDADAALASAATLQRVLWIV